MAEETGWLLEWDHSTDPGITEYVELAGDEITGPIINRTRDHLKALRMAREMDGWQLLDFLNIRYQGELAVTPTEHQWTD